MLNVRIGAADFCSIFGIRRSYQLSIYDIAVIRDCIAAIINTFSRQGSDYVISGPVWEYFSISNNLKESYGYHQIKAQSGTDMYLDGLINEVLLDKANGLMGKTVIHPSHIIPVQSLYVVTHEEYTDALSIINGSNGEVGVFKSHYSNKMNEIKTHLSWARKIITRSRIYGVFNEHQTYKSLITIK